MKISTKSFYSFYVVRRFLQRNISLLLLPLLLLVSLTLVFRLRLFSLVASSYAGHFELELLSFLAASLSRDLPVILLVWLVSWLPVAWFRQGFPPRFLWPLVPFTAYALLLFSGIVHFAIFEIPLQVAMLGSGLESFWQEIVTSALYEISGDQYRFLILGTGMALLSFLFLGLLERGRRKALFGLALPLFFAALWPLIHLGAAPESVPETAARRQLAAPLQKESLYHNPLATLLSSGGQEKVSGNRSGQARQQKPAPADFVYGLDTDSLVVKKHFPRLSLPRGKKYNIVFYFFESTAHQYIGMRTNGQSLTPVWDRLQTNSFVAQNHYTHFPLSVNAMFSVLASAYDHPTKTWVPMAYPAIGLPSLSEILAEHGYKSAVLHSGNLDNFGHRSYLRHRSLQAMVDMYDLADTPYGSFLPHSVDDRALIEPSLDFMEKAAPDPFFAAVFPLAPHNPYLVPEDKYRIVKNAESAPDFRKKSWLRYHNALYYGDATLGMLIEGMRERGLMENTLVFVFADHGEAFYQHTQNYLHALFLYEENVHVPMLIYNEELFPGGYQYEGVSRHIDLAPTVLDLLGLDKPDEFEGISLFSAHRQQLALLHSYWNRDYQGLRDGKWKYILDALSGQAQLYDLARDPREQSNQAAQHPELTKQFRSYLEKARAYKYAYYSRAPGMERPIVRRRSVSAPTQKHVTNTASPKNSKQKAAVSSRSTSRPGRKEAEAQAKENKKSARAGSATSKEQTPSQQESPSVSKQQKDVDSETDRRTKREQPAASDNTAPDTADTTDTTDTTGNGTNY